jgi:hypothetical protein
MFGDQRLGRPEYSTRFDELILAPEKQAMSHFHFKLRRILAQPHRNVVRDKSAYIRRSRERDLRSRTPVRDVSTYMRRVRELDQAKGEVLYSKLYLPAGVDMDRDELWDALDQAARRRDGEYKRHGGHMPCLSLFCDASLPRGLSDEKAIEVTETMAKWLVEAYDCGVEAAIHVKGDQNDHAHFLITDRTIDVSGVGGKIRSFNGLADLRSGGGTEVEGGRRVAGACEAMRAEWARLVRSASGDDGIDHRSFKRRGLDVEPCPYVPRAVIERERLQGTEQWREDRERRLAARAQLRAETVPSVPVVPLLPSRSEIFVTPEKETPSIVNPLAAVAAAVTADVDTSGLYNFVDGLRDQGLGVDTWRLDSLRAKLKFATDPAERRQLVEEIKKEAAAVHERAMSAARAFEDAEKIRRQNQMRYVAEQRRLNSQPVRNEPRYTAQPRPFSPPATSVPPSEVRPSVPPASTDNRLFDQPRRPPITKPLEADETFTFRRPSPPPPAPHRANPVPPAPESKPSPAPLSQSTEKITAQPSGRPAHSTPSAHPIASARGTPEPEPQHRPSPAPSQAKPAATPEPSPPRPGRDREFVNATAILGAAYWHEQRLAETARVALAKLSGLSDEEFARKMGRAREQFIVSQNYAPAGMRRTVVKLAEERGYRDLLDIWRAIEQELAANPPKRSPQPTRPKGKDSGGFEL